jgi:hypothetical protein
MIRPSHAVLLYFAFLVVTFPAAWASGSDCSKEETYENHNQVDYGPLRVSKVQGVATDPSDAPVPHACVLLFTERNHNLVFKTETDDHGQFDLAKIKSGSYRLVVKAYGFCSANVPIIVRAGAGAKRLMLHMKMGEVDACSYGALGH